MNHTNQASHHTIISPSSWIELNKKALIHNIMQYQAWLPNTTGIAGVLKSNAYGHGILEIARIYEQTPAITCLCVISLSEAITLREKNIKKPILILGYLDQDFSYLAMYPDIEVALYDLTIAQQLNEVGKKYNKQITVHIKIDTGLSRLGILLHKAHQFIEQVEKLPFIFIKGIFSHLSQGYDEKVTEQQEENLQGCNLKKYTAHIASSHASITTKYNYSMARIGLGLYGYLPGNCIAMQQQLKPVLSLKSKIIHIKTIPAGSFVGYDQTYQAPQETTIAILAVGYAEGIDIRLSNKGFVLVHGRKAPILGKVSMNLTAVDISNISNCFVGQTITLLGQEKDCTITAYDWAHLTQSSVYERLTKLCPSLPRHVLENK